VLESRRRLARWLSARACAVGAQVGIGMETSVGGMAVGKTPRSRTTYLALISAGVKTPAGEMAVGKMPLSRGSGERRDRDGGWREGCWQAAAQ